MAERRRIDVGTPCPPRDPLYAGEVHDGGGRIRVWAADARYGITIAHSLQEHGQLRDAEGYLTEEHFSIDGGVTLSLGGGLSLEQAEALITELTLAVRAKRLANGEPWHGREVASGVIRAPQTGEGERG